MSNFERWVARKNGHRGRLKARGYSQTPKPQTEHSARNYGAALTRQQRGARRKAS